MFTNKTLLRQCRFFLLSYSREFLVLSLNGVERAVVAGLLVPVAKVVVGHHVDNVQALAQGRELVGLLQDGLVAGDGGGQNEALALVDAGQGLV